jgi:hypothetical protein
MGGQALRTEPFKIVGVMRERIAYGWADIRLLAGSDGH